MISMVITAMNGNICITSVGMLMPATCIAVVSDRQTPNSSAPISTQIGRPRASMASTMPRKPAPLVMYGTKMPAPILAR